MERIDGNFLGQNSMTSQKQKNGEPIRKHTDEKCFQVHPTSSATLMFLVLAKRDRKIPQILAFLINSRRTRKDWPATTPAKSDEGKMFPLQNTSTKWFGYFGYPRGQRFRFTAQTPTGTVHLALRSMSQEKSAALEGKLFAPVLSKSHEKRQKNTHRH